MKTTTYLALICAMVWMSGCGSDGGGAENSNISVVACNSAQPEYTALQSGDRISSDVNTRLDIRHNQDGSKKACTVSGAATIIR